MNRPFELRLALCSLAIASTLGCALVKTPEAQLFTAPSRYESASITYRVAPQISAVKSNAVSQASFEQGIDAPVAKSSPRKATLAIRFPHPTGRAGYARVEYIVESAGTADTQRIWLPRWLEHVRRFANDSLPGVSLADGVEEAMGLDLPMAELDRLVERLQQPIEPAAAVSAMPGVVVVAKINGQSLTPRHGRVAELDGLIGRVCQEGRLIAYRAVASDAELDAIAKYPPAQPSSQVVPASFAAPAITRLPPVTPPAQ